MYETLPELKKHCIENLKHLESVGTPCFIKKRPYCCTDSQLACVLDMAQRSWTRRLDIDAEVIYSQTGQACVRVARHEQWPMRRLLCLK
jgi:hypothetical protein